MHFGLRIVAVDACGLRQPKTIFVDAVFVARLFVRKERQRRDAHGGFSSVLSADCRLRQCESSSNNDNNKSKQNFVVLSETFLATFQKYS